MKFNQLILESILLLTLISCSSYNNVKQMCPGQISFEYKEHELANSSSVYIIKPDGSDALKITPEGSFDSYPVWSPDGQKLAFLSRDDPSYASQRLFVSQANGTARKNLSGWIIAHWRPIWSPDSKMIVFVTNNVDRSTTDLYLVNADGTQLRRLTYSGELQKETTRPLGLSPDGQKVFFEAAQKGSASSLDVININGKNQVRLIDSREGYTRFYLSPDSQKILAHNPSDTFFLINTNGFHRKKSDYRNLGVSIWSPNSTQVAFSRIYQTNISFFVVNIDSLNVSFNNLPKLTISNQPADRPVAWSPDGQKILYLTYDSINIADLKSEGNSIVWQKKPSLITPNQPSYAALTTAAWQPVPCP
jgi:Tol biopolymer transport system component